MGIQCGVAVAVIDDNIIAIGRTVGCDRYIAGISGIDIIARISGYINAGVESFPYRKSDVSGIRTAKTTTTVVETGHI